METILVVEDCPINRFFLEKGLGSKGFTVASVRNGQEALEWLESNPASLVLMDVQMPVLDGLQATRRIREAGDDAQPDPRMPIIAVTACASEMERQRCLDAGMDEVLAKPIVLAELCELIRSYANGGASRLALQLQKA